MVFAEFVLRLSSISILSELVMTSFLDDCLFIVTVTITVAIGYRMPRLKQVFRAYYCRFRIHPNNHEMVPTHKSKIQVWYMVQLYTIPTSNKERIKTRGLA